MAIRLNGLGMLVPGLAAVSEKETCGEGVAVVLSDNIVRGNAPQNQWIVTLSAKLFDAWAVVGRVLTSPPNTNGEPQTRIVAVANMPGAIGWRADFRGPSGAKGWANLVAGNGVGAGCPGVWASRPRPRPTIRSGLGASVLVVPFDVVLMGAFVSDTSDPATPIPAGGLWVQFFNKRTAPVNGDVPIFQRKILPNGSFDVLFDAGLESGDNRYSLGLGWALSTTPAVLTLSVGAGQVSVQTVLG